MRFLRRVNRDCHSIHLASRLPIYQFTADYYYCRTRTYVVELSGIPTPIPRECIFENEHISFNKKMSSEFNINL
jgi:hypothetical protein